jgi:uncharacterized protein YhbP (UPF0306 family)
VNKVKEEALHYLENHQVMTLATWGDEGVWAAAVFYVNQGFDLYFLSAGHTRHALNFKEYPRISAAIQEDYKDWAAIQGIQLEGTVTQLVGTERDTAVKAYADKYPFLTQQDNPQIKAALTKVNWYQMRPTRLYFIDNSKGLGHRDEVTLVD